MLNPIYYPLETYYNTHEGGETLWHIYTCDTYSVPHEDSKKYFFYNLLYFLLTTYPTVMLHVPLWSSILTDYPTLYGFRSRDMGVSQYGRL